MTTDRSAALAIAATLATQLIGCDKMKPSCTRSAPLPAAVPSSTQVAGYSAVRGPSPIVFAKGRLAELMPGGALRVLSLPELGVEQELPAHAAGAFADGTLIVLGPDRLCTLAPGSAQPACRRKLTIAPPGLGWVWGEATGRIGVLEDDVTRSYTLAGDTVRISSEITLAPHAGDLFAPLSEGNIVWADNVTLYYVGAHGQIRWHPAELGAGVILHVAAGPPGQVWVSQANGLLTLLKLGAQIEPVRTVRGDRVLSLAATPTHVATVVGDTPRLVVRDAAGAQVFETALPPSMRALSVALSPFAPLVAVGGYGELALWNLDGKLLGKRP